MGKIPACREIVGGSEKLRKCLSVEQHALELWLADRATPPEAAVLTAMEIVLQDDLAQTGLAPRTKILLAVTQPVADRLIRVLGRHDLRVVTQLADATRLLAREDFGMVIIGVYFDESRMFEFLHHVRINRREPAMPVVCVLGRTCRSLK